MRRLMLLLVVGLFLVGNVVATHVLFTSRYPGANDFASRWGGARAFWREGFSPYSDEATRQIQLLIYGRPIQPEEEQEFDPVTEADRTTLEVLLTGEMVRAEDFGTAYELYAFPKEGRP